MVEIKDFIVSFFQSLKCDLQEEEGIFRISKVPEDFEKFYGKPGPYFLVFEKEKEKDNTELIGKGSFLLKTISNYLESRGKATLLKIKFDIGSEEDVKKIIKIGRCKIKNIIISPKYEYFVRFGFLTDFQYLNEKEQETNYVFVEEGKIINFNLDKYNLEEGSKNEVKIGKVDEFYTLAKEAVKEKIRDKKVEIGAKLKFRLEKESLRIKEHYSNQIREIENSILRNNRLLVELEKDKLKGNADADAKIKRIKDIIEKTDLEREKERLEKEMNFVLNDELHKHGLNINNKLINTTIIYYPKFKFDIFIENDKAVKKVVLSYDPLKMKNEDVLCENCDSVLDKIMICKGSHLICDKCEKLCLGCRSEICKKCKVKQCEICGRENCKDCIEKCYLCLKNSCKNHLNVDYRNGKLGCFNCLKQCSECKDFTAIKNFKKCKKCDKEMCIKCSVFKMNSLGCKTCVN